MTVDEQLTHDIVDVFSLLGVLLVFVIAYITYLQDRVAKHGGEVLPPYERDRGPVRAKRSATRRLVIGAILSVAGLILLLLPLSIRVMGGLAHRSDFPTVQMGLLVVDVFLIGLLIASCAMVHSIWVSVNESNQRGLQ